jgi:phage-related tail fiber protein
MTAAYYSILTNNGKALIANATVSTPIGFSDIAVGDGNGSVPTPLETRTALVNEKARFTCNSVALNPNNTNWIEAEIIIPTTSGGYTIRELGLYAGATLVAVANFPSTYKPLETEGGAREIAIKMVINVQNAEVISVTLDNSLVYATRDWVNTYYIPRTDIVDNLTTNDASKPVSAKQVKVLQDNKLDKTTVASDSVAGIVKLLNDLTTGGTDKALTAEQGKILNAAMFGVRQTWQDVKSSRASGTIYTNSTGRAICVYIEAVSSSDAYETQTVVVGGATLSSGDLGIIGMKPIISFIVPNGSTYSFTTTISILRWSELR